MLLRSFWGELAQEDPSEVEGYLQGSKRVSKFLELQPPVWSHRVWESQMSQVAQALEQEEIRQLHFLHAGLETIVSIHNRIRHLDAEQEQVRTAQIDPFEKLSHPKTYGLITSGISLLSEVEKIATDVLSIPLLSIDGN
ncbi:MAG TPA: hypothetical protein VN345_16255 [Blastocatellia bacterium]|nr:hypothetical protein [Blastocatellia bacterium]